MIKQAALVLFLFLPQSACGQSDDNNRAPVPLVSRTTNPDENCNRVCENLLAECGSDGEPASLALDDCSLECQLGFFSEEEKTCLADLACNEPSDACLRRLAPIQTDTQAQPKRS
jgi:hypothetical protein